MRVAGDVAEPVEEQGGSLLTGESESPRFILDMPQKWYHGGAVIAFETSENWDGRRKRFETVVSIERLTVSTKGQGQASRALEAFLSAVDGAGHTVRLLVSPLDKETDQKRLEGLYARFGFVAEGGNLGGQAWMIRLQRIPPLKPHSR